MAADAGRVIRPDSGRWAASQRGFPHTLSPAAMAGLFALTAFSTEIKFRLRDPTQTFSGILDVQIAFELVIWAIAAVVVFVKMARELSSQQAPWSLSGRCLRRLVAVAVLTGFSAVLTLSIFSVVRAAQFGFLVFLGAVVSWRSREDPRYVRDFWTCLRWVVVVGTLVVIVAAALYPSPSSVVTYVGVTRYRWFAMHPIGTATILGLAIVMITGRYLDRRSGRSDWLPGLVVLGLLAGLAFLLWQTRARGALGATLVALSVLIAWSPSTRRKRRAVAAGVVLTAGLLLVLMSEVGIQAVRSTVLRNEDVKTLLSLSQRTDLFRLAGELFVQRPVFGYGYLQAGPIFIRTFPWAGESHSVLIEIVVSMGLVGLAAYGVLIGGVFRRLTRAVRMVGGHSPGLAAEGLATLVYILVTGTVSEGFAGSLGLETVALVAVCLIADSLTRHPAVR